MPYSKASFINHTKELKQGKTIIEAQPMPLFYEVSGLSRSTADVLSKQSELMEREMESQTEEGKPLSPQEQEEIDLLREIQRNYQKHLQAKVTIDADISPVVRGRNDAIRRAEKGMGIEYPYHFVWLDNAENESGIIEFPWDGYSKVYAVQGSYEEPEIVFLQEAKAGDRTPKKPYYECVDGKTLVHVEGFSGAGTEQSPFEVADYSDLCKVGTGTGGWSRDSYYLQTADIQCPTSPKHNFLPIGNSTNKFTGQYDGNNKTIKDLYISRASTDNVGLFGYADNGRLINIGAEDVDVTGNQFTGGIIGQIDGANALIGNCHTTGIVKSPSGTASTVKRVGGVLGGANNGASIINSHSTATVTITGQRAGGFAGQLWTDSSAENCYATGKVTGDSYVGGFVCYLLTATVSDCYATGEVESSGDYTGGFVARAQIDSYIEDCHATGDVTGGQYTGGFVGWIDESTTNSCYAEGKATGDSRVGGFAGIMSTGIAIDCHATGDVESSGERAGGFVGQMQTSSSAENCYAEGEVTGGQYTGGFVGWMLSSSTEDCYAEGDVDGGGKIAVGGFVGVVYQTGSSFISYCFSLGNVQSIGANSVGGFLGNCNGASGASITLTIENSYAMGNVIASDRAGGFAGTWNYAKAENCYSIGSVSAQGNYVRGFRGIISSGPGTLSNCFWDMDASGISTNETGAVGKTTAEMQSILTYSAWDICEIEDFDVDDPTIWYIDDGEDYPRLWWEYEGGEGPSTAQTPITATSSMSVTGRKIITAQAPITAKSKATVQVKKIAKAEAHIKATSALTIEHTAEEAKIGYGQADIKTYSSLLLTTKKRARSPPAEIEAETKLTAEGRKVTAQEAHISGTSKMQVACRKVAKGETTLTAGSEISVETSKTAKAQTDIKAESALTVKGKSEVHAPGEAHIKGESRLTVAGRKVVSATVELSGETKLKAETTKTAKAQVGLTADSGLTVQGRKVAQAEVSLTADSALKAEAQKTAQVEIAETAASKTTVEAKTIKQAEADITATSQTKVTATASIPHAGQARIKATSKTKAEAKKIAAVEVDITAKSELKITGRKVVSREVKETADSKLSVQVKAVKQGQVALTATSKIEAETRGEVYDITGEAHIKATSKMAVAGRKVVLGTTDIKADSKLKVQVETIRQAQADITATGKAYVAGRYRPPYKRLKITLGIQEREITLGIQEREITLGIQEREIKLGVE